MSDENNTPAEGVEETPAADAVNNDGAANDEAVEESVEETV